MIHNLAIMEDGSRFTISPQNKTQFTWGEIDYYLSGYLRKTPTCYEDWVNMEGEWFRVYYANQAFIPDERKANRVFTLVRHESGLFKHTYTNSEYCNLRGNAVLISRAMSPK